METHIKSLEVNSACYRGQLEMKVGDRLRVQSDTRGVLGSVLYCDIVNMKTISSE